jgi:transposase
MLSPANRHDSMLLAPLLDAIPSIRRPHGGRRRRPDKAHADKAYDIPRCHAALRARRIRDRSARKGVDSSAKLGRVRWVIERTFAWLNRDRRLTVRYERRADIHEALVVLGCALICWNYLQW